MFHRIRTRLAAALAVPLAVLVVLAGLQAASSARRLSDIGRQRSLALAAVGPGGVVTALQNERNLTTLDLLGLGRSVNLGVGSEEAARSATDAATLSFRATVGTSVAATAADQVAIDALAGTLPSIRYAATSFGGTRSPQDPKAAALATSAYQRYSTLIDELLITVSSVAPGISDSALRNGAEILDAGLQQSEAQAATVHDVFDGVFAGGLSATNGTLQAAAADLAAYRTWTDRLRGLDVAPYSAPVAVLDDPAAVGGFTRLVDSYLAGATPDLRALLHATAATTSGPTAGAYRGATSSVAALAAARADHLRRAAEEQLALYLLVVLAAVVFGALAVLRASHSISRPLVRLAAHAESVATGRLGHAVTAILEGGSADLPDPPGTAGRDEVAAVARSLGAVQTRALSLAVEQATLRQGMSEALTNLGRRNQNLVSRQLDYITTIEKGEADPDKLDQLFRLDHLATRMRRNAESLLVLGGADSPRQWSAPVPIVDVVRSALAEVEDFRRVQLGSLPPSPVAGRVTSDMAHLLAELIENGLSYSPPHTRVEVTGAIRPEGYLLTITDSGLGMDPDALEQANRRLAGTDSTDGSQSRFLGLFVAGRLGARHGARITLRPAERAGTVAEVLLPPAVMPELPPAPADEAPAVEAPAAGAPHSEAPSAGAPGAEPALDGAGDRPASEEARPALPVPAVPAPATPVPAAPAPATAVPAAPAPATAVPAARVPSPAPDPVHAPPGMLVGAAGMSDAAISGLGRVVTAPPAAPIPHVASPVAAAPPPTPPAEVVEVPAETPAAETPAPQLPAPQPPAAPAPRPPLAGQRPGRPDLLSLLEPVALQRPRHKPKGRPLPMTAREALAASPGGSSPHQATVAAAAAPAAEEPDGPSAFERWLDSRLEQLAALSVEQAVTAAPPRPLDAPAAAQEAADATEAAEHPAGLPRRQPGRSGEALGSLRRRGAEVAAATEDDGPRVSSSLFRYLSAVDQRPDAPEGTTR